MIRRSSKLARPTFGVVFDPDASIGIFSAMAFGRGFWNGAYIEGKKTIPCPRCVVGLSGDPYSRFIYPRYEPMGVKPD